MCECKSVRGGTAASSHARIKKSFQGKHVHSAQDCIHLAPWCRIILNYVAVPVVCDFEAATIFFHDNTLGWPVPLERAYVRPASRTPVSVLSMDSVVLTRTRISATQHNSSTQHINAGSSSVTACEQTVQTEHQYVSLSATLYRPHLPHTGPCSPSTCHTCMATIYTTLTCPRWPR